MAECRVCFRHFASDRIEKHEGICKKAAAAVKKRKVFDPTKMRMQGTEAEPYLRQVSGKGKKTQAPPPVPVSQATTYCTCVLGLFHFMYLSNMSPIDAVLL
jgi:hypothetical protein